MDKLTTPRKAITAHAWAVPHGLAPDEAEAWLCAQLDTLLPQRHPLVVLGVPGWWPANEAPGFYEDPSVFRPRRGGPVSEGPAARPA